MKILFTIPKLAYSGAPKMISWVANQMAKKGHNVHLVAFFSEEQARVLHENVTFHSLGVSRGKNWISRNTAGMAKTIYRLHKLVNQLKPDVVVSFHNSVSYAYLPIGALLTKSKLVISERADPYSYGIWTSRVRSVFMKFAHGCAFQTNGAQKYYVKNKKIYRSSTVIPNPVVVNDKIISMQQSVPAHNERDKRIVTVGRLSLKQKRQDVLLEAFKIFHKSYPEYKLVIYGDGQDGRRIQMMVDQMNLTDCVILAGRIDNVEEEIFRAGAFVLSSDFEGIPNALIEALSIGVPSVSTDCCPGGAALLLKDGENGFLVPCGDAQAIADKLSLIVSDANVSQKFSKNGPHITNEFSEDVIADKWEEFFERLVKTEND